MKLTFTIAALFLSSLLWAQLSLDRQVIASTGQSVATGTLQVDYTVGETVITTASAATLTLTQGFHQPEALPVGIALTHATFELNAYPNPTQDQVTLDIQSSEAGSLTLHLVNSKGQTVQPPHTLEVNGLTQHRLDLRPLASGTYFLRLQSTDKPAASTLIIQKIQ